MKVTFYILCIVQGGEVEILEESVSALCSPLDYATNDWASRMQGDIGYNSLSDLKKLEDGAYCHWGIMEVTPYYDEHNMEYDESWDMEEEHTDRVLLSQKELFCSLAGIETKDVEDSLFASDEKSAKEIISEIEQL